MPLLNLRNPLAYPGGTPGLNPGHVANNNLVFSAAMYPGGIGYNLITGAAGAPTAGSAVTNGRIGPAYKCAASNSYMAFSGGSTAVPAACTMAAIFHIDALGDGFGSLISTGLTAGMAIISPSAAGTFKWESTGNGGNITVTPAFFTVGHDYFIVVSSFGSAAADVTSTVIDLTTGKIGTGGTPSGGATLAASDGSFRLGTGVYTDSPGVSIACGMTSYVYLNKTQQAAWAKAPWDFWYPPTVQNLILSGLNKSGGGTGYNKTVPISSASALTAIKSVGKIPAIASTSALTVVKSVGKIPAWTTTSAVSVVKAVGKVLGWTTTSAVSTAEAAIRACTVAIASSSAVSVIKQVGKILSWTTTSALSTAEAVTRLCAVAISTASAVTAIGIKVKLAVVSITSSSALTVIKQAGKIVPISSASALTMARATAHTVGIASTSALTALKAIAHTIAISSLSALSVAAGRAYSRTVSIASASAVTISTFSGHAYSMVVGIVSTSAVTISTLYKKGAFRSPATWLLRGFRR